MISSLQQKFLFSFFLLTCLNFAQNAGDTVFTGTKVFDIDFVFSQPNFWDSLTIYYTQNNEQYIVGQVFINGILFDSVGVRLKGNSSYSHPNNKKSFRISFDEYIDDLRWDGLKGVHLNNCWGDPTFMREKMHLDFCRDAGVPAPRANYARVTLNGQAWGLYSLVEHVDKRFLSSRFNENDGDLFKAVDGFGGGNPQLSDFRWYGAQPALYFNRYELKTEESITGWDNLVSLIDTLNNNSNIQASLPNKIDLRTLYRAIAVDNMFSNLDSYAGGGRNFYFYFPLASQQMKWIVWDASLSFGAYSSGVATVENISVTYVSSATNRPLVNKIFNNVTLRNEYLREYCYIFKSLYSSARLNPKIDSIANIIRPYVIADPKKMYTVTQFETNLSTDINASGGGGTRKPGLKSLINLRTNNINTQFTNLSVSCALPAAQGEIVINEFMADNNLIPDPAGQFDDWIEFYNNSNNQIDLSGLRLTDNPNNNSKWTFPNGTVIPAGGLLIVWADEDSLQEGLHASFKLSAFGEFIGLYNLDGSVIDTITFGPQITNLSMARIPNGTGNFIQLAPTFNALNTISPSIAPFEVVINEFMALNETIPNPSGNFEDWIELYNNTNLSVDLSGKFLSDDFEFKSKWQFPKGTIIEPFGFLIIWADDDSTSEGLHTNFKLSGEGEQIYFSNSDSSKIDSVTFGVQIVNKSLSRIPNGTGSFTISDPTFNSTNNQTLPVLPGDIVINEFAALNDSIPDPVGQFEDWIEIFNNSNKLLNLGGLHLSDRFDNPGMWQFPQNTFLQPYSYLIIWADEDPNQPGLHANFKLSSSNGEQIVLSDVNLSTLDSVIFGPQQLNKTMARIPNGKGVFVEGTPTFNSYNGNGITILSGDVVINEFMAANDSFPDPAGEFDDWIELFNNTNQEINLEGTFLTDNDTIPNKWQFPTNSIIPANGYLIVWADENEGQEGLHSNFKLSASGEKILFSNFDLSVIDQTTFGEQTSEFSYGRLPNGTGNFSFNTPTPGATNLDVPNSILSELNLPLEFKLSQNYPNPFSGISDKTEIHFSLPQSEFVSLILYNIPGEKVLELKFGYLEPGIYNSIIEPGVLSSGVYIYSLRAGGKSISKKMLVIK